MSRRTIALGLLAAAASAAVLVATDPATARVALAAAGCLLLPGLGWARKMRFGDLGDTVALALVLSICTTVAVGTAMAVAGAWSLGGGLAALALVALGGFLPARALANRATTAVRLRTGGPADDGGAWAQWHAETLQQARTRRRRSEVAAREAAAVWVDWYSDVERRADEERAREETDAQRATADWIAWYQRSQIRKNRTNAGE